jgi:hypothetical protein
MTTATEIGEWFDRGVKQGATHMIVVCDTYDHSDYPVFAGKGDDVEAKVKHYRAAPMSRVLEVYNLSMDRAKQLGAGRVFNL